MRTPVAALLKRPLSIVVVVVLSLGLTPIDAFASKTGEAESGSSLSMGDIINEELPLDAVIAQAESTKSFFLAQTLESTRTVPMVSAKLPIDSGTDGEGAEGAVPEESVSAGSTVVGAFEQDGMTFAIEADGGSVALMAVDYAKLPREFVERQVVVIPETVSSDGIDSFSVARIGSGAFSSLKKESADPAFAGCEALFSDEELLAEAGIDPSEVEGFLDSPEEMVDIDGDGEADTVVNPLKDCSGILALGTPASVSSIDDGAFAGFETLQYIVVFDGNSSYASFDGALYNADLTNLRLIPEGRVGAVRVASRATSIAPEVFSHCPSVDVLVADADSEIHVSLLADAFDLDRLKLKAAEHESGSTRSFSEVLCAGLKQAMLEEQAAGLFPDVEFLEYELYDASSGVLGVFVAKGFYLAGEGYRSASATQTTPIETPDGDNIPLYWRDTIGKGGVWVGDSGVATRLDDHGWAHLVVYDSKTRQEVPDGYGAWFSARDRVTKFRGYYGNHPSALSTTIPTRLYWLPRMTVTWDLAGGNVGGASTLTPWYVIGGGGKLSANTGDHVALPMPVRNGYSFNGWYLSTSFAEAEHTTMSTVITGDTVLYARWTPNTYAVSFDANGGSGGQSANVTATYDAAMPAISTAKPVRAGYAFSGWYDTSASSGGTQYYTAACASARTWNKTGPATLYARWAPVTYGISYDDVGGSFSGKTGSYTIESNDFALPASGMRTGFTFAGWEVTGASGSGIEGNGTTNVTVKKGTYGNLAAKAIWTINVYHLSWNVSHGTHANRTEDFTVEDCPIAMGEVVPDAGYAFLGWSGTGIAEGSASFALTDSMLEGRGDGETFSYTASFAANPYTARLHANDGTGEGGLGDTVEHAVTYDAPVSPASVPKRYGYVFSGYWTKGADGSKEELYFDEEGSYARDAVWKDASDVDLYACWTLMANLEVPVNAPSAVSFTVDRALEIGEGASGTQAGPSVTGALRSSVPQEVPIASIELEPLQDADGTASASRVLGEGNPERCAVEVSLGSSASALLRLADATGAPLRWEPPSPLAIPAAVPVASGTTGEDVTSDGSGNLARLGELPLSYAMKLLPGFDVYRMPAEDATSEPVARIVFTVDLTGLEREEF